MKNYYLWLFVTVMLLGASSLKSAEIIPVWNKTLGEGSIQDMQLLKGGNEFLLFTGFWDKGQLQVRNTMDGELIRSQHINAEHNGKIIITPDSNRFIVLNGIQCELRNLDDTFSIIKTNDLEVYYTNIAIDPIKPYIYVTGVKMLCYNYETGEIITEFKDYISDIDTKIAVSDDGKYLATLNNGKAYLKVWDLATMEQIRNVQLWDDKLPDNEYWCDSKDIQFSKLNSDVIFYSGYFTKQINEKRKNGVFKFNISANHTTRVVEDGLYDGGLFIPFDNENRFFISRPFSIYVLNVLAKQIEFYQEPNSIIHASNKLIYSQKENSFIGTTNNLFDKFIYDFQTNVITDSNTEKNFISPNPTTGILNILINNKFPSIFRYDIISDAGQTILSNDIGLLQSNNNSVNINISSIPIGHYLLRISSDREIFTFNIIKE